MVYWEFPITFYIIVYNFALIKSEFNSKFMVLLIFILTKFFLSIVYIFYLETKKNEFKRNEYDPSLNLSTVTEEPNSQQLLSSKKVLEKITKNTYLNSKFFREAFPIR